MDIPTELAARVGLLEQRADALAASLKVDESTSVSTALLELRVKALEATSLRLEDAAARLQQATGTNIERRLAALEARLRGVSNLSGRMMALDAVAEELGVTVPLAEPPPLPPWGDSAAGLAGEEHDLAARPGVARVGPVVRIDGSVVPSKTKQELVALRAALELAHAEARGAADAAAAVSARVDRLDEAAAAAERRAEASAATTSAALEALSARIAEVAAVAAAGAKALARARDGGGGGAPGFAEFCKLESRVEQIASDGAAALCQAQATNAITQSSIAELKAAVSRTLGVRDCDRALQSAVQRLRADVEALAGRIARVAEEEAAPAEAAASMPLAVPPPAANRKQPQRKAGQS